MQQISNCVDEKTNLVNLFIINKITDYCIIIKW